MDKGGRKKKPQNNHSKLQACHPSMWGMELRRSGGQDHLRPQRVREQHGLDKTDTKTVTKSHIEKYEINVQKINRFSAIEKQLGMNLKGAIYSTNKCIRFPRLTERSADLQRLVFCSLCHGSLAVSEALRVTLLNHGMSHVCGAQRPFSFSPSLSSYETEGNCPMVPPCCTGSWYWAAL